jgi:WD40 repeat protein
MKYLTVIRSRITRVVREMRRFIGHSHEVTCRAFNPDGRCVLNGESDRMPKHWDAGFSRLLREWQLPWVPQCVAWNSQQPSLVVIAWPNSLLRNVGHVSNVRILFGFRAR